MKRVHMRKQSGSVLVICLMLLGILGITTLWVLKVIHLDRLTANNQVRQVQAFYLAEAGMGKAVAAIRENPLWRGEAAGTGPTDFGELSFSGYKGTYSVTVLDATDDGSGRWEPALPGGVVRIFTEGRVLSSYQSLSCDVRLSPSPAHTANSPKIAVISSGDITLPDSSYPVVGFDERGQPDAAMVQANTVLPQISRTALKAMADDAVDDLDDALVKARFLSRNRFWRDGPADTRPYVVWIRGDLDVSEDLRLNGIFFVEGRRVSIAGDATLHGILYAPDAQDVTLPERDPSSPDLPIKGQVLAGNGGVRCAGDCAGVQLVGEYVDAFNDVGGGVVEVSIIPGTRHRPP